MNLLFKRSSSSTIKIVVFSFLSIVLMIIDRDQNHLKMVRSMLSTLVYPIQYMVNVSVDAADWISHSLVTRKKLMEENEHLKKEHLLFNLKLQRYEILESENQRLRRLLESSSRLNDRVLVAELIEMNLQSFRRQIVINKGIREGAYDGQPIVDSAGVVGQIMHAGPFSSTVLLITDPNHALPVQVNRNGLRAIAVGTDREDRLLLKYVPNNADLHIGDLIISSGLGGRFPAGYPVGQVEEIELDTGEPFAHVTIKLNSQFTRNREVLMVWPQEYSSRSRQQTSEVPRQ